MLTLWEDARDTFECSALRVECVTTAAYLTSHSLYSLSHRAEEVITKIAEASVGAAGAARCYAIL